MRFRLGTIMVDAYIVDTVSVLEIAMLFVEIVDAARVDTRILEPVRVEN